MSTSLAAQLKKLSVPQTTLLDQHDKKKASLLFNAKDAAALERTALLEIGRNGLQELIKINKKFEFFQSNLFANSSLHFERAIQNVESNKKLDKIIKHFCLLASSYFLLKSTQQALEWLISRYKIHEYNKDDFIALILPYHETNMFVRSLQVIPNLENSKWHWLYLVQKANVVLAKSIVINQCSSDIGFFKFLCNRIIEKTKTYEVQAKLLVVDYSFFCTTIIGALTNQNKINEQHISHLLPVILKALSYPNATDFISSGYMIISFFMTKLKFKQTLVIKLLTKIIQNTNEELHTKTCMLIILIYQTQFKMLNSISGIRASEEIAVILSGSNWFIEQLKQLSAAGVFVTPLMTSLTSCLLNVLQHNYTQKIEQCTSLLIQSIVLDDKSADVIIRSFLENYQSCNKEEIGSMQLKIENWFCVLLKQLYTVYPNVYKNIITWSDVKNNLTIHQKLILNAISNSELADVVLNKNTYAIFDKLCDHNVKQRVDALEYLASEYFKLSEKDKEFLNGPLTELITNDNNPIVVNSLLKLSVNILNILTSNNLVKRLLDLLSESQFPTSLRKNIINLLCSNEIEICDHFEIFLNLLPFFFPTNQDGFDLARMIIYSDYSKKNIYLKQVHKMNCNAIKSLEEFCLKANNVLFTNNKIEKDQIKTLLGFIENEKHHTLNLTFALIYLSSLTIENYSNEINYEIFNVNIPFIERAKVISKNDNLSIILSAQRNILPLELITRLIESLIKHISIESETNFDLTKPSLDSMFLIKIYKTVISNCLKEEKRTKLFTELLKKVLFKISINEKEQIKFISNLLFNDVNPLIDTKLVIQSICLLSTIIKESNQNFEWLNQINHVENSVVPSILICLMNCCQQIRIASCHLLKTIYTKIGSLKSDYSLLLNYLLKRTNELTIDEEQLSLILYTILSPDSKLVRNKEILKRALDKLFVLENIFPQYFVASIYKMLSLINSTAILENNSIFALKLIKNSERLNNYESKILISVVCKINANTIRNITLDSSIWKLITALIDKPLLNINDNLKEIYSLELILNIFENDVLETLPHKLQLNLIQKILEICTECEITEIRNLIMKFFKRIDINCEYFSKSLNHMYSIMSETNTIVKRRLSAPLIPSIDTISKTEWKIGITVLEILQNKKKIHNVDVILPILFNILRKCLDFEEQAVLEYPKQLLLSCILNCCRKLSPNGSKWTNTELISNTVFDVESIVQCIRITQNPQTHHHALLLLSHLAGMLPQIVLHHIMNIFTFIGSSVLRHDDAYSFQIITKIIDVVIPILTRIDSSNNIEDKNLFIDRITPILRVFVAALIDIPVHRRVPLFENLLNTLNVKESLWIFLLLVFDSHILHGGNDIQLQVNDKLTLDTIPKRLEIAKTIINQFEPEIILYTCLQLLQYIKLLPLEKSDKFIDKFFDFKSRTPKQFRHYKYIIVTFVSNLLSSETLIRRLAEFDNEHTEKLESFYRNLIIAILTYIQNVSKCAEQNSNKPQGKYWKVMLHHCFDILENINCLLCSDMFLRVCRGLMSHNIAIVRRKTMELFNSKLQQPANVENFLTENNLPLLFELLDALVSVVSTIDKKNNESEDDLNQQTALFSIKLLAKKLAYQYPDKFRPILDRTIILMKIKDIQSNVQASLILCFAELCSNLRVNSLYSLSNFMPIILKLLAAQKNKDTPDFVLISVLTAVYKILETLPSFLSPFLEKMLIELSVLSAKWFNQEINKKVEPIVMKLKAIQQKIAQSVPHRILIPIISRSYTKLITSNCLNGVVYIMDILSENIKLLQNTNLKSVQNDLIDFFLSALQFRADNTNNLNESEFSLIEGNIIKALIALVLKLSESSFRPLFYKLFHWSTQDTTNDSNKYRAITFYRLSSGIAECLKGLFVLFAGLFLKNAANLLDKSNNVKNTSLYFEKDEENCFLLKYILETLHLVFLYDNHNFVNRDRFELLMQSLVDQLENTIGGEEALIHRIDSLIVPCIGQFAVATGDDSLWKQLNYQILLKTRNNSPLIRLGALKTLCEVAKRLGEDFLPLLPETIPFLAELLEDEDENVELACQKAVQNLEKVLGEPLQKYF